MKRHAILSCVGAVLLAAAVEGAPPQKTATPTPRPSVKKDLTLAPTPMPFARRDLLMSTGPCSVQGTLKFSASLLAAENAKGQSTGWKSAYSGSWTITFNQDMVSFKPSLVTEPGNYGIEGQFFCSGWGYQSMDVLAGQSQTHQVTCHSMATPDSPHKGKLWFNYTIPAHWEGGGWGPPKQVPAMGAGGECDGRITFAK